MFPDLDGPFFAGRRSYVLSGDGPLVEIMDQWPHCKQLPRAFGDYLPGFDAAARQGIKACGAGERVCYDVLPSGAGR